MTAEPPTVVSVYPDPVDGGWVAEYLPAPGCISQGDTLEEALGNLVDAIRGVLAAAGQVPQSPEDP